MKETNPTQEGDPLPMGNHHNPEYYPDGEIDKASLNETPGISIHLFSSSFVYQEYPFPPPIGLI
jgi:hypothetical protein